MPFDEHVEPDVQAVLDAAAMLDITEYELFRLAHRRWHGERTVDDVIEPFFVAYMFDDAVPPWVRDYARMVVRLEDQGELDRVSLGIADLPRSQQMVSRGMRYGVALVAVMAALFVMAEFAAEMLKLAERCSFPPCY